MSSLILFYLFHTDHLILAVNGLNRILQGIVYGTDDAVKALFPNDISGNVCHQLGLNNLA